MSALASLVGAEWFKLTRRPLTRILLAASLALLVVQLAVFGAVVAMHAKGLVEVGPGFGPAELEEYRRRATFPGVIGAVFSHLNGLGGIFTVILAGAAMGSEYGWGTLRTQLSRTPDRTRYLIAKVTALVLLLVAGALAMLACGLAVGAAIGVATGGSTVPDAATLAALPLALARALYVLMAYVLVAVWCATWGRSQTAGIAGGFVYLVLEAALGAGTIFAALGEPWRTVYGFTIGQNISTLTTLNAHAFGLRPEVLTTAVRPDLLPSPAQATLVVALYCATLFVAARRLLRRDLPAGVA